MFSCFSFCCTPYFLYLFGLINLESDIWCNMKLRIFLHGGRVTLTTKRGKTLLFTSAKASHGNKRTLKADFQSSHEAPRSSLRECLHLIKINCLAL